MMNSNKLDLQSIPLDDKKTWAMIQKGLTVGCFQLESSLGQHWARTIKPSNITELSAVIALIRPASLESGQAEQYAKIKSGQLKQAQYNDVDVMKILEFTHGTMFYQEQLMAFGSNIAWKHLPELEQLVTVDVLRKSVGHKDSKKIQKLKASFIEGCIHNGKSLELANDLFNMIERAGRYCFCAAHSFKYAYYSYITAYLKNKFPLEFYTTYLSYSRFKMKPKLEIRMLIDEAKLLGITILPPCILEKNSEFRITQRDKKRIRFGLSHIKGVGPIDMENLQQASVVNWTDLFLTYLDKKYKLRSTSIEALIGSGACDCFGVERSILLQAFKIIKDLSVKEKTFIATKLKTLESIQEFPGLLESCAKTTSVTKRKDLVLSEASQFDLNKRDSFTWRARQEKNFLGMSLTCSEADDRRSNKTACLNECNKIMINSGVRVIVAVVLDNINKLITKKGKSPGQEMAILNVSDKTGSIRVACFPKEFMVYKNNIFENSVYELEIESTGNGWCMKSLSLL